jgi:uncharacterized protein (TIGR03435 family)
MLTFMVRVTAQPLPQETFEVASVKLEATKTRFSFEVRSAALSVRGAPLGTCIRWAYGLPLYQPWQLTGPAWLEPGIESPRYEIDAKTEGPVKPEQMRFMMRALLTARFKLVVHWDTHVMPVYVLSAAKGGSKLHASEDTGDMQVSSQGTGVQYVRASMAQIIEAMEQTVTAPIIDETGLEGRYDLTLDPTQYRDFAVPGPKGGLADWGPVYDQALLGFGLRLRSEKRPMPMLVVDRVEKTPTEN